MAGETYAVIHEVAGENVHISEEVLAKFKQLSTDNNKYRYVFLNFLSILGTMDGRMVVLCSL